MAVKTNTFGVGVSIALALICCAILQPLDGFSDDALVDALFVGNLFII
jgi:hypothetical protein